MDESHLWIKVCGVTSTASARVTADGGVDAIGLNFVSSSKRHVDVEQAKRIVRAVGHSVEWIGLFVNADRDEMRTVFDEVGLDALQLHGEESPELVEGLGVPAFKAVRIGDADDVALSRRFSGERILVDAKVAGSHGGTGQTFDWSLVRDLAQERKMILAGGLGPDNVAEAVRQVRPFGIDTASGVERAAGSKDAAMVRRFVDAARAA